MPLYWRWKWVMCIRMNFSLVSGVWTPKRASLVYILAEISQFLLLMVFTCWRRRGLLRALGRLFFSLLFVACLA